MNTWLVSSSDGFRTYTVEERIDSKNGGIYLHCSCPGWVHQFSKGKDCRHAAQCRPQSDAKPLRTEKQRNAGVRPKGLGPSVFQAAYEKTEEYHTSGDCGGLWPHSKADHEAARLMGVLA